MVNYLIECMTIAVKGSIGVILWMIVICFFALIFFGAVEFFKVLFSSKKDPGPEADRKDPSDVDLQEEEKDGWKIIDGGKDK